MDFTMMFYTYISLYFAFKHSPLPLFYPHAHNPSGWLFSCLIMGICVLL